MKIMVAYASAGRGHHSAAEAIYDYIRANYPDIDVRIVDALDYTNPIFSYAYSGGYYLLAKHLRFIWSILYYLSKNPYIRCIFNLLCRLNNQGFVDYLVLEKPDVVATTHFFPSEIVSFLKKKNRLISRLITIVTDFGVHPLWINPECDGYIVGSDYAFNQLKNRGIPEDKIKVLGIPLRSDFLVKSPRQDYQFSAVVLTGSFGFSFIEKIVDILSCEINLWVVCGNNHRLYNRLRQKNYKSVSLFGFTKDIAKLMSQVDVVITKPGGLGIAEALAMDLPLVFISGIPGQESENARILEESGAALRPKGLKGIKDLIMDLKVNPEKLNLVRANIAKFKKPKATEEICKYVCSGSIWASGGRAI
jgi:processive 1,2-diacylglycerol beta-glucosyltransferase